MKTAVYLTFIIALGILSACNVETKSNSTSNDLSYQFNENGCDTGSHSFSSNGDYCTGLQNNSLNNGCAMSLRQKDFEANCPGATFNPF